MGWHGTIPIHSVPTAATTQKGPRRRAVEDKAGTALPLPLLTFPMDCQPVQPLRGAAHQTHPEVATSFCDSLPKSVLSPKHPHQSQSPIYSHRTGFPGLASSVLKWLCSHGGTHCRPQHPASLKPSFPAALKELSPLATCCEQLHIQTGQVQGGNLQKDLDGGEKKKRARYVKPFRERPPIHFSAGKCISTSHR